MKNIWKRTKLKRKQLTKDISEKEASGNNTILNRKYLKHDLSKKDEPEKELSGNASQKHDTVKQDKFEEEQFETRTI